MSAPLTVDTVTFTDQFDFGRFANDVLLGGGGTGALPTDHMPLDWVFRALAAVAGTEYEDRFTNGIADCITAPDPIVRVQALMFFAKFPRSKGAERLAQIAQRHRSLYKGIANPLGGADLDWWLLRAIGGRIELGDDPALQMSKQEALHSGAAPLLASLTSVVPDWVSQNAAQIVARSADTASIILMNLEQAGHDIGAIGEQLAPLGAKDPTFRDDIDRFIEDPSVKARILAAIPAP